MVIEFMFHCKRTGFLPELPEPGGFGGRGQLQQLLLRKSIGRIIREIMLDVHWKNPFYFNIASACSCAISPPPSIRDISLILEALSSLRMCVVVTSAADSLLTMK